MRVWEFRSRILFFWQTWHRFWGSRTKTGMTNLSNLKWFTYFVLVIPHYFRHFKGKWVLPFRADVVWEWGGGWGKKIFRQSPPVQEELCTIRFTWKDERFAVILYLSPRNHLCCDGLSRCREELIWDWERDWPAAWVGASSTLEPLAVTGAAHSLALLVGDSWGWAVTAYQRHGEVALSWRGVLARESSNTETAEEGNLPKVRLSHWTWVGSRRVEQQGEMRDLFSKLTFALKFLTVYVHLYWGIPGFTFVTVFQ